MKKIRVFGVLCAGIKVLGAVLRAGLLGTFHQLVVFGL